MPAPAMGVAEIQLGPGAHEKLTRIARRAAVPFKSVLLAIHVKAMALVSGQDDVLTSMVSNGRPEVPDGEQIRGLFLNDVPFRLQLGPGTWCDLARQAFETEREILPFRRYPLAEILKPFGRTRLIETEFNISEAARRLGMHRRTLARKLEKRPVK